ncbi:RDD family protein [Actinomycetospora endophytica]|uniref:RDD family protein n=1 Tax=Actinomycetospora endophytica TaxID=2291215 RepID=A0ABS8PEI6_9PSEU|nr:RDD family protein [Actinomycetospora endophytica]MCD2196679.1 RDD family protein [Actinomycetospora endophytica]
MTITTAIPTAAPAPIASLRRRLAGFVLDLVGWGVLSLGVWALEHGGVLGRLAPLPYPTWQNWLIPTLFVVLMIIVPALCGRTVGMAVLRMRVRAADGRGRVGFWRMILRGALIYVDLMLLGLVALVAMRGTREHQRLGDLAARTVVERCAPRP